MPRTAELVWAWQLLKLCPRKQCRDSIRLNYHPLGVSLTSVTVAGLQGPMLLLTCLGTFSQLRWLRWPWVSGKQNWGVAFTKALLGPRLCARSGKWENKNKCPCPHGPDPPLLSLCGILRPHGLKSILRLKSGWQTLLWSRVW